MKVPVLILSTELPIITVSSPVQLQKALLPIAVTLSGIVSDVKLEHPLNAPLWISITDLGIMIDDKLVHPENAHSPISLTEFGIVTDVSPVQSPKVP